MIPISYNYDAYTYEAYFPPDRPGEIIPIKRPIYTEISSEKSEEKRETPREMADRFLSSVYECENAGLGGLESFLTGEKDIARERIGLLCDVLDEHEKVRTQNLERLYNDLFEVHRLHAERPFPYNYRQDNVWMKLVDHKLKLYEEIRREMKDHQRAVSMSVSDLVNGLLEYRRQKQQSALFEEQDGDPSYR